MAGKTIAYLNVLLGANNRQLTNALSDSEKRIKTFGRNLENIGSSLSLRVSAPLAAIGYIATQTTARFSDSMLKVKALSSATGDEFERLESKAQELGSSTRFSASQVADAMGFMALAGFNTNQTLAATPAILSLAAASATDLASASDIVTDTMSAYGIQAQNASRVSDLFALTQAKANTNVLQLGEAFKYVAPNFASANQSIEDTSTLLAVLANNGFKGSMAGTALNAMLKDLISNSRDGAISIGNTAVAIYDSNGTMRSTVDILSDIEGATKGMTQAQRDAALGALFEERSIRAVNIVLNSGTKELRRYQELLNNATGSASKMADEMESGLGGSLRKLNSSLESIQIIIGDNLAPTINTFANIIQGTAQYINSLDKGVQRGIVTFGMFAAVLPPIIFAVGKLTTLYIASVARLKVLAVTYKASALAASSFGTAVASSILPITATIAALYGIYKAGEYFNKNSEKNKRVTAELTTITKQSNSIKKQATEETQKLNTKVKDFNKLSEEERKRIIASTQAKILDLEASIKQQKALAQLTAKKAMELTLWEKFTSYVMGFGNAASTAYRLAEKSAEKFGAVMGEAGEATAGAEAELNTLKELLNQIANQELEPLNNNVNGLGDTAESVKKIFESLNQELKRISVTKEVDSNFDNIDARISTLKSALIDLRMTGISPLSDEFINVKKQYDQALDTKNLQEFASKLDELSFNRSGITVDVTQGTTAQDLLGINANFKAQMEARNQALFDANMNMANNNKAVYAQMAQDQSNFNNQFIQSWQNMIQNFKLDITTQFAEGFGALIVQGKNGINQFASGILGSFGKFLVQMGKMGLVYAKFAQKIQGAFLNPAIGIGASLALIAVGGAMSAFASNINSAVGGGGAGSNTFATNRDTQGFNNNFLNSRGIGKVEFEIKGDKLVGVLDNYNRFKRRF
jgi:TP901 family phage tail tape measure protein